MKTATPICPNCGSTDVTRHGHHSTCDRCKHTGINVWFGAELPRANPMYDKLQMEEAVS